MWRVMSQLLKRESLSIINDLVNHISFNKLIDYFVDMKYDKPFVFIFYSVINNFY
jgi:hypothetical protein